MQKLTQTRPDNCWQTCVAAILDRAAESVPVQHLYPNRDAYTKALRVFLDKHYGLTYVEVESGRFLEVFSQVQSSFHLLLGPSPRTSTKNNTWHAIVGFAGKPCWDPNPSRAGLTEINAWGLLVPTPPEWRISWAGEHCVCANCVDVKGLAVAC